MEGVRCVSESGDVYVWRGVFLRGVVGGVPVRVVWRVSERGAVCLGVGGCLRVKGCLCVLVRAWDGWCICVLCLRVEEWLGRGAV